MDQPNFAGDYDVLLDLVKSRASVRKLKPDPIPDDYVTQILEVGRWAMSGANGQSWDFIVVKNPDTKKALFRAYIEENNDFIYWMEQQREFKLRHPSFQMTHDEALQKHRNEVGWSVAPALIVIVGDGRRQWATVQGAHTFGRDQSHLTDGLANTSMMMHLAAAALGLGSQHVTIHIQEPFKRILGVPDKLRLGRAVPNSCACGATEVGIEAKIFEQEGLEIEVTSFRGDAQLQQALAAGSIDVGLGSGPGLGFRAKGAPAIGVAAMYGPPANLALVLPFETPIKAVSDLKGKRIGVTTTRSLTDWLVPEISRQQGWGVGAAH